MNNEPKGNSIFKNMQYVFKKSFFNVEGSMQQDLNNMKILMSKNQYIPKVVNYSSSKSFVINEATGNVVSLPFSMSCRSSPLSSKVKVVIIGSIGLFFKLN